MKYELKRNDVELNPLLEKYIERRLQKFDRVLADFNPDLVFLRIHLEKIPRKELYQTKLTLEIPNRILHAEKQSKELMQSIGEAFDALWREFKRHKEFLSREPLYRRKRPGLKEQLAASQEIEEEVKEEYLAVIERLFHRLYNFARREIAFRIYQGQIRPGSVLVSDVLDEAIVETLKNLPEEYDEKWLEHELYRKINQIIKREARAQRIRQVPLEKKLKEPDSELEVELWEYYQPDNIVRLEDVVPDNSFPTPEQALEEETIQQYIEQTLALMPENWRQAFCLNAFEGFSPEEIAMIQGRSPSMVKKDIQMAREFLKEKLMETGLEFRE